VNVVGLKSGVKTITVGWRHTCALMSDGGVKCWGNNHEGQLGDGSESDMNAPAEVVGLMSNTTGIAAGERHTCALTTAGGVKCWGNNHDGQLGDGTRIDRVTPVDVVGLASGVTAITAGWRHTCALMSDGGVKCWGNNHEGQLGDGSESDMNAPAEVVGLMSNTTGIAAGERHTCALTTAGGVKCWGNNHDGQLGDGTRIDRVTPVDVVGLASGVTAITAGWRHTCALMSDGGVKCWGNNHDGQLGDGTDSERLTPVEVKGLSSGVLAITARWRHTCALTTAGGVKCWGNNHDSQLGDGTKIGRHTPVDVDGLASGVTAITAGWRHTCALASTGGVKCWGNNHEGQLGDGTGADKRTPVDVLGLTSGAIAVAAGGQHTCALGQSWIQCWGDNEDGQLGDGTFKGTLAVRG
jgi:alpha-tubulin suppressor-like RCC1 family protein